MKTHTQDRTRLAVCLCIAMLLVCLCALAHYLAPVLFAHEEPEGAAFGLMLIDIDDEDTAESYHVQDHGVYVLAVQEESPACQAGVGAGDRLLSVNELPVEDTSAFVAMQDQFRAGEQVRLDFQRGADATSYVVTLVWNAGE